jgi:hypothetical protein
MNENGPVLRDIHLPPDPSWWPPAPGWWMLAVLLLIAIAYLIRMAQRRVRERRWRQRVRAEIESIAASLATQADPTRLAAEISQLLRRASLLHDPHAAALSGEAWLGFLDAQIGGDAFSKGAGRVLLDAPFRRVAEVDAEALLGLTRTWLTQALAKRGRNV